MSEPSNDKLYRRLPAIYRRRDRNQDEALRALLGVFEQQRDAVEQDIEGLYENLFLETSEEWVLAYLGDLLGVTVLGDEELAGVHPRLQIARTLAYRDRKGTPGVLEAVSRDIVGWFARVVEQYRYLGHTQNVGQLRRGPDGRYAGGFFDVRRPGEVALGPFTPPERFRNIDVERIASRRGLYNIPNLAFYLWRLGAYYLADSPVAESPAVTDRSFRFDPLDNDLQLFNRPELAEDSDDLSRRSRSFQLPVAIDRTMLDRDLQGYRQLYSGVSLNLRPTASAFFGPERGIDLSEDDGATAVDPLDVAARNLDAWGSPGIASADISGFAGFTAIAPDVPEVQVTLGDPARPDCGPRVVALPAGAGDTLEQLADRLERAIRSAAGKGAAGTETEAATDPAERRFRNARVFPLAGGGQERLLVISGEPGDRVLIEPTMDDTTTAGKLGLDPGGASPPVAVAGAWSGVLEPFPDLASASEIEVTVGAGAAATRMFGSPTDVEEARTELETALQTTTMDPAIQVVPFEGRLIAVKVDGPDTEIAIAPTTTDPLTARVLDLAHRVAIDPQLGRALYAPAATVTTPLRSSHAYGFSADLGGGPYDRRDELCDPDDFDLYLEVGQGGGFATLADAVASWDGQSKPNALIRILDSDLYEPTDLAIELAAGRRLVIEADDGARPVIRPIASGSGAAWAVTGAGEDSSLVLSGLKVDGGIELSESFELRIDHSTLVPVSGRGSLTWGSGNAADLSILITFSIVGALQLPSDLADLRIEDSIVDAASEAAGAGPLPALVSAPLGDSVALSAQLELDATIGGNAETIALDDVPVDLPSAATELQQALNAAGGGGTTYTGAEVEVVGDRLLVRPGDPGDQVRFAASATDPGTAGELALTVPPAMDFSGLLSGDLTGFTPYGRPQLRLTLGNEGPRLLVLDTFPGDISDLVTALDDAIAATGASAGGSSAFNDVAVSSIGDRVMVEPGSPDSQIIFSSSLSDSATVDELNLLTSSQDPFPGVPEAARRLIGAFSGDLSTFPTFPQPELTVTIDSVGGPTEVMIGVLDPDLAVAAGEIETALQGDFPGVQVVAAGDRLLIAPVTDYDPIEIASTAEDPSSAADLALTEPPAVEIAGRLSGDLSTLPTFDAPQVGVTVGAASEDVTLGDLPQDAAQAASLLEAAIQAGAPPAFQNVTVLSGGDRLLIDGGGNAVSFAAAAGDTATASELGLTTATDTDGLLSGVISTLPTFQLPEITIDIDGEIRVVRLGSYPSTPGDAARVLEEAVRAADLDNSFAAAEVAASVDSERRLYLISGDPTQPVEVEETADDMTTADDLALAAPAGEAVEGYRSGDLTVFPVLYQAELEARLGAGGTVRTVTLWGQVDDLDDAASVLESSLRCSHPDFDTATVTSIGDLLLVESGAADNILFEPDTEPDAPVNQLLLDIPPAEEVRGLISDDLSTFPTFELPSLDLTFESDGPNTVTLAGLPADLATLASQLENAIQGAPGGGSAFTGATVQVIDDRLFITPSAGDDGDSVTAAASSADPGTVGDLMLTGAGIDQGRISGDLSSFPSLQLPVVRFQLGATGPVPATFADLPADLSDARSRLETAIQAADAAATFTGARVLEVDDRLLVLPGVATDAVTASTAGGDGDPDTADELALTSAGGGGALEVRISDDLTGFSGLTDADREVEVTMTEISTTTDTVATATLTNDPGSLAAAATELEAAIQAADTATAFTAARVVVDGSTLMVIPGALDFTVSFDTTAADPTTAGELELDSGSSSTSEALLSDDLSTFPALTVAPAVAVTLEADGPRTATLASVPTTLAAAASELEAAIQAAPGGGASFTGATVEVIEDNLLVIPGTAGDRALIADIAGSPTTATDLALTDALSEQGLLSGDLSGYDPANLSAAPQADVTLGAVTATAVFDDIPSDLATAASELEAAIQAAHASAAFTGASVTVIDERLLVEAGTDVDVSMADPAGVLNPAASLLLLDAGNGTQIDGLLSGDLSGFMGLTGPTLELDATFGGTTATATFGSVPADLATAAQVLEAALRAADADPNFTDARVLASARSLVILPGVEGSTISFAGIPSSDSPDLVDDLKLDSGELETVTGLLSGTLADPIALAVAPAVIATLGSVTATAVMRTVPADLSDVADELQAALRSADSDPNFTGAQVLSLGERLLVLAGGGATPVEIEDTPTGTATASGLKLSAGQSEEFAGLLSGPFAFPRLLSSALEISVTFGSVTATATLAAAPTDLATTASQLETALFDASDDAAFMGAQVIEVAGGVLVIPGAGGAVSAGDEVSFAPTATDPYTARQLQLIEPPAQPTTALRSGDLATFPNLCGSLVVDVTIGGDGPHPATLTSSPTDVASAASALQAAIQAARPDVTFTQAQVLVQGDRLLIFAGVPGLDVEIDDRIGADTVASKLLLTPASGGEVIPVLLSGDPRTFPQLTVAPKLSATLGGETRVAFFDHLPSDLDDLRLTLRRALRNADPAVPPIDAFALAEAEALGGYLLVTPGGSASGATFANLGAPDPDTATDLGLDPGLTGLLSGDLSGYDGLTAASLALTVTLGGDGPYETTLASLPTDLTTAATALQDAIQAIGRSSAFTAATVEAIDDRLFIQNGIVGNSIAFGAASSTPTVVTDLRLGAGDLLAVDGLLSGLLAPFPTATGTSPAEVNLTADGDGPNLLSLGFPTTLSQVATNLQSAIQALGSGPPVDYTGAEVTVFEGRLRVVIPGIAASDIDFTATAGDPDTVALLALETGTAVDGDGLISGPLSPFPLLSGSPVVEVTLGDVGPVDVRLSTLPTTPAQARDALETAVRQAHPNSAFAQARVGLYLDDDAAPDDYYLVLMPGDGTAPVVVDEAPGDTTASEIGFGVTAGQRPVDGLRSGPLPPLVTLSNSPGELAISVTDADGTAVAGTASITLPVASTLADTAVTVADAIRTAGGSPPAELADALVVLFGIDRLVLLPGVADSALGAGPTTADSETIDELALTVGRAFGTAVTDDQPGPPMSLLRTTVFGRVVLEGLELASEVLFAEPLRVVKLQQGCVRYSFLPSGSLPPRCFRCQPALALVAAVSEQAALRSRELGLASPADLPDNERESIFATQQSALNSSLRPRFTSTRYGDPGYAQLASGSAPEITSGAEDGSEIGAFQHLQQVARLRQLEELIDQYLRFGLDAGIFTVT